MMIVDAHRDIAFDAIDCDRDYRRSVAETRRLEKDVAHPRRKGQTATGLPDAITAGISIVGATLFVEPADYKPWGGLTSDFHALHSYHNPQEAHDLALEQLHYYEKLAADTETIRIIRTESDLDSVLATWEEGTDPAKRQQGFLILMEGADPVIEPSQFDEWYERGVRILGTSWSKTRYAGGTSAPGPLTELGRQLLAEMAQYHALLDVSHMAEEACLESLYSYQGPIFASHANPRAFCDTDRHLTDEAIKLLAGRDGVMGLVLLNLFWKVDWKPGNIVPISRIVDAVDHICQLTGSARHVGIGTDWNAGMGSDEYPHDFDTVADLPKIAAALTERGYSQPDVEGIMSGNMLRVIRAGLPAT
ncbi:MAG: membrane dipeptidase [Anaerolineae bacterium]